MAYSQSAFEAMPLELHSNVLSHLGRPEDVLSAIRASPAALRALQTGRERIYLAVVEACLAPEVFCEFLAIVNAPDHKTCPSVRDLATDQEWAQNRASVLEEWKAWERKAGGFLESHARGAEYEIPTPKPDFVHFKAQIKFIVRLYFCLSRLVDLHPTYTRHTVKGTSMDFPPAKRAPPQRSPFTDKELLRLQRGLLRYELCCRLIGLPSIAAFYDRRVFDAVNSSPPLKYDLWELNPLIQFLPIDEVEEVICASEFVHGLYRRLNRAFAKDFMKAVQNLSQGRDAKVSIQGDLDLKKNIIRDWPSNEPLTHLDDRVGQGTDFRCRLGLAFLDRLVQSGPIGRMHFIGSGFDSFRGRYSWGFLKPSWYAVLRTHGFWSGGNSRVVAGPHCNAILQTSVTNHAIARLLGGYQMSSLRRAGWAFFEDLSRLGSMGLPPDATASSIRKWVHRDLSVPWYPTSTIFYESATSTLEQLTAEERGELYETYSPKYLGDDFQAMSQFVAEARAIVDFSSSNRIPPLD